MTDEEARTRAQTFVRDVEAAMAGLPSGQRAELTGGLVDHLLEPGDDGRRPIDDDLDPRAYADELRAAALPTPIPRARRRAPYVAGAALLGLVIAGGAWLGFAHPWSRDLAQPEPSATSATSPGVAQVQVPDVRGLSQDDALAALRSANLTGEPMLLDDVDGIPMTDYLESGDVATTDPFRGTLVEEGSVVVVMVMP